MDFTWLQHLLGITDLHFWTNPTWWAALGGIIWVDILLSGDNALVIGMVAGELPPSQRRWAVLFGTGAAILLRVVASLFMTQLLLLPYAGIIGAIVLFWIAIKLIVDHADPSHKPAASLGRAIVMIVMADITMSIDNMMAIAGLAHGDATLVGIGLIVSIALIIAGATIISSIIARYPWLTWVGGLFLGWIAGGIAAGDPLIREWVHAHGERAVHYGASAAGAVIVLAVAGLLTLRANRRAARLGEPDCLGAGL